MKGYDPIFFTPPQRTADRRRILYKGGGGSSSGSTTTVQKADPWAGQQPYLTDVFTEAQKQYQTGSPQYFPGQVSAGADPLTTQAQNMLVGTAPVVQGQADITGASNVFNMTDGRDVRTNPYLQSAIQAAINPMIQNFNDAGGVMSNIRTEGVNNQQGGGSRQGVAEGIAASRLNQQIGDVASSMANEGYKVGLDASTKAIAMAPQVQGMQSVAATALDSVGQQRQDYEQQIINDAIQKWNWEQNLPSAKLAEYQNLIQGNYGGSGTSTTEGTNAFGGQNRALGAIGGAMSGYAMAGMLGMSGPVGAGLGALLSFL